jgi:hypothetical protein
VTRFFCIFLEAFASYDVKENNKGSGAGIQWKTHGGPRQDRQEMRGNFMRSDLIYGALAHISNRYQLCQLASKATRKLHKPNTRLQDTTNEVLVRFHHANPVGQSDEVKVASERISQQRRAA